MKLIGLSLALTFACIRVASAQDVTVSKNDKLTAEQKLAVMSCFYQQALIQMAQGNKSFASHNVVTTCQDKLGAGIVVSEAALISQSSVPEPEKSKNEQEKIDFVDKELDEVGSVFKLASEQGDSSRVKPEKPQRELLKNLKR